jgi:hypothetical protein
MGKNYYFFEGCNMYNALEKELVYVFFIRDKYCIKLCEINIAREPTPDDKYGMWGVADTTNYRTTPTRYIDKELIKNWNWVATDMNGIIHDILKMQQC